jgi:hypothetical protein
VGAAEVLRIAAILPLIESWRLYGAPGTCLRRVRARGVKAKVRSVAERARLQRLIGYIDHRLPGGPNCYRRALIEMALDPTAAGEPFRFGLRRRGGPKSGHAWLADRRDDVRYDAEFRA